jgi:hypothetical protein
MNETIHHDSASDVPWLTSDRRMRVPDTSSLPDSEKAAPAVRELGDRVSAAEDALHAKTDQLRDTRDAWVESMRTTVRRNPLGAVAAAVTLGAIVARIEPEVEAGQARGARCLDSPQPVDVTVRMKHLATDSVQRPPLALLGADGNSVATLRKHCRSLGYDAFDWGQGFNTGPKGDLDVWLHTLKSQVADLLAGHTQPATLIGWSLGGLYAREIGKLMAPRIRQVITMEPPFNAAADHTTVGWLFRMLSGSSSTIDLALSQRLRTPPPMRTTSIYSLGTVRPDQVSQLAAAPADTPSPSEVHTMFYAHAHKPHHPDNDVPEEFEPGAPPVEPDEGPVPAQVPDDPEHDRVVDPAANLALQAQPTRHQLEVALCP